MTLYQFLLLKSFILEIRFINIQPDTLTFTDLKPVEQILKKIRSCLKVLWHSLPNNFKNAPTFNIFRRVIRPFLRVRQDAT